MSCNIRNIALFAHVDAGKTSITENFLFTSGTIRNKGNVNNGNTQTDRLEIEKQRGISVKSEIVSFNWKHALINLIDTPGHIDFSAETERSIVAIDGAVVVLSAVEGLQAQAENIIRILQKHRKPFLVFINKIDREGADIEAVLQELQMDLSIQPILMQNVHNIASENISITQNWTPEFYKKQIQILEKIVESDVILFEKYLNNDPLTFNHLDRILQKNIITQQLIPVYVGAAKYGIGITELLDAIVQYLPEPAQQEKKLSGIVFKTKHVKGAGKWAAIRLFSGKIKSRQTVYNTRLNQSEKIKLIKNTQLTNPKVITEIQGGEIAWIQGWDYVRPGDVIGEILAPEKKIEKTKSLLSVQVRPQHKSDNNQLITALQILYNEDPELNFQYFKEENELHIAIRGEVQKEILIAELQDRFGLSVHFSDPSVIYKETPSQIAEGYVRYWMPKPCWAIMRFRIAPGKRGSGVIYRSEVSVNDIKKQYQKDVEKTIPKALQQGILGWEVTDIEITLIEGEDHEVHTKSNDFAIATPMGIMDGLQNAQMSLLEPILQYTIKTPEKFLGTIAGELTRLRARIEGPEIINGTAKIWGEIPLATSLHFPIKLSSISGGKAKYTTRFSHYALCDTALGKTRPYKGISPLDTAKYILKARKAL